MSLKGIWAASKSFLENRYYKEKHETLRMEVIEMLVKKHSDDADLGKAIREFISLEKCSK